MRAVSLAIATLIAVCATPTVICAAEGPAPRPATPELGLTLGYTLFAETSGLGNAYYKDDVAENAPTFGLRFAYPIMKGLAIELDGGVAPVKLRAKGNPDKGIQQAAGGDATVITTNLQARYSFMPGENVDPFVAVGAGMWFQTTDKEFVKAFDNDAAFSAAAGANFRLSWRLLARADVRWVGTVGPPAAQNNPQLVPTVADGDTPAVSSHLQVLLGLTYLLGGPEQDSDGDGLPDDLDKCPNEAEDKDGWQDDDGCPDLDNDGDGIPDTKDKCPNEAEDKDGFQDDDGCPEADNDGDGIPDAADKCPNQAEDKDGFEDEDGCPDLDNDKDGIPDSRDRCKNTPEDKDGFQDDDGCPESDNDRDGVPDAKDKCPNKAETVNGIEDEDGCPDQLPEHIAVLFDGPLKNVTFNKKNKLNRRAGGTLEKLLELMLENEKVIIEIHAHVDVKGNAAQQKAISLQHATIVRKFYEDAGIDPSRFILFGHGNEKPLANGRGAAKKNNRVELKVHRPGS